MIENLPKFQRNLNLKYCNLVTQLPVAQMPSAVNKMEPVHVLV